MTTGIAAFGTLLKRGAVTIAEVVNISGPGLSLETADVTAHDGSGWREFVATVKDAGEVTVDINYDPDGVTHKNAAGGLINDLTSKTSTTYSITWPDATVWSFTCFVTNFEPGAPFDDKLTASVTLRITGAPTIA